MTQAQVFDENGLGKTLAQSLAQGGEGVIYPLLGRDDILVKCYHPDILAKSGSVLQQKIDAMSQHPLKQSAAISWPLLSIYNHQKQWIGYAMKRKEGIRMHSLAHPLLYSKHFPALNRQHIVTMLLDLIKQINKLHQQGVMIGDYNLNNFLCDPQQQKVYLIDCDSYQLQLPHKYYPCPVGSPDLTPVEHHGMAYRDIVRTPESESFSLAIILFKCLMLGRHPYDVVGGNDPVQNLKNGQFAYGQGGKGIPKGAWYNIWSHMPFKLKSLFVLMFKEGAVDPSQRPTIAQWQESLSLYLNEMNKSWHETAIKPAQPKSSNYQGSLSQGRN